MLRRTSLLTFHNSFLNYVVTDRPRHVEWAIKTFRRIGEATGLDLPRNMDRLKLLGKDKIIGSNSHRELVEQAKTNIVCPRALGIVE